MAAMLGRIPPWGGPPVAGDAGWGVGDGGGGGAACVVCPDPHLAQKRSVSPIWLPQEVQKAMLTQ